MQDVLKLSASDFAELRSLATTHVFAFTDAMEVHERGTWCPSDGVTQWPRFEYAEAKALVERMKKVQCSAVERAETFFAAPSVEASCDDIVIVYNVIVEGSSEGWRSDLVDAWVCTWGFTEGYGPAKQAAERTPMRSVRAHVHYRGGCGDGSIDGSIYPSAFSEWPEPAHDLLPDCRELVDSASAVEMP